MPITTLVVQVDETGRQIAIRRTYLRVGWGLRRKVLRLPDFLHDFLGDEGQLFAVSFVQIFVELGPRDQRLLQPVVIPRFQF